MFADQALSIQKSTFTSYEHVHILVEAESIKTIASVDIRRITLHQTNRPDGGDIIYELGTEFDGRNTIISVFEASQLVGEKTPTSIYK